VEAAIERLAERIRAHAARAADGRAPLRIRAGGSKDFYGNEPRGDILDPRELGGVIDYQPSELVVTVRAGTSLAELEALLAGHRQMLAFEPPHFAPGATVGGCVAAGLAGPRRASSGTTFGGVRDFVLGATLLDGRGDVLRFGGTVMKNVAGYDVSRLLAGSLGMLGVVLSVSLKVLPQPAEECTLQWPLGEAEALSRMREWAQQPLPVSATLWADGVLSLRLAGAAAAIAAARRRLGGASLDPPAAQSLWRSVREQTHPGFDARRPLWRLSLPPAAAAVPLPAAALIEWSGAQRWLHSESPATEVRAVARQLGGHATLFRAAAGASGARQGVFTPLSAPLLAIHRNLRAQFDPHGVFDAGRLVAEL